MPDIYVDADACPVKDEVLRVAARHGLTVYMVSNNWLRMAEGPRVHRIVVTDGFDAADDWIAGRLGMHDIVVTADIALAARCLEKGARALAPNGKPFTDANIGMAMAMRDLMSHLRSTEEITGGSPSFSRQDRSRFLMALEETIRDIGRST